MTVDTATHRRRPPRLDRDGGLARLLALLGGLVLVGTFASVLYHIAAVVGDATLMLGVLAGSFVLATVLAGSVGPRVAMGVGGALLAAGVVAYAQAAPLGWQVVTDVGKVTLDVAALLTGVSLLQMTEAGAWALGFAPAPVFLSWYLLVRREYALAVAVGGATLLAFGLTTDAGQLVTLVGVLGGASAVGFGELDRRGGTVAEMDVLAVVLAAMVVTTTAVSVIPAGGATPLRPGADHPTIEAGFANAADRFGVVGSISLSPEVQFTVESDERAYWKVGAYDRYTGDGWVRSGQSRPYERRLSGPPGPTTIVEQRVTAETDLAVIPAAWRPVRVEGAVREDALVSSLGALRPRSTVEEGTTFEVVSRKPDPSQATLESAGWTFPDDVRDRYTQLPEHTPDRVTTFTDEVVDGATGPYETAERIEAWLQANKGYSLEVERPSGSIADRFLFEQEAGYCVYFATTMVVMLRTQGVPARLAVGYTPGQQVDDDTYVVRGLDSHAWVEVYVPDAGWIQFDPTPAGPRQEAELARVEEAREQGTADVDAAGSESQRLAQSTPTPTGTGTDDPAGATDGANTTTLDPAQLAGLGQTPESDARTGVDGGADVPRVVIGLGLVVLVGLAAGVRRTNAVGRTRRFAGVYYQRPTGDPAADVRRAVDRLEYVLASRYRDRRPSESHERYLRRFATVERDDRLRRIADAHMAARYSPDGVAPERARETVDLVDEVVREYEPLRSRLRNRA